MNKNTYQINGVERVILQSLHFSNVDDREFSGYHAALNWLYDNGIVCGPIRRDPALVGGEFMAAMREPNVLFPKCGHLSNEELSAVDALLFPAGDWRLGVSVLVFVELTIPAPDSARAQ